MRIDLTRDPLPPTEPLAMDVHDTQGRLVVRAGEQVTRSLLERLRKLGILEIFVTTPEASSVEYWKQWGEEWLQTVRGRMLLLTPDAGVPSEELDRFNIALEKAVTETVRQKMRVKEL